MTLRLVALVALSCPLVACDSGHPTDAGADAMECTVGEPGCACGEAEVCGRGHCVAGICALCTRGDESCSCRRDGTCEAGLACQGEVCAACPEGSAGCACLRGADCDEGSTCTEGVCAADGCAPGSEACPCRVRGAPACDEGLTCLGDGMCHSCDADRAGCACGEDGACATGLACDLGQCKAPPTCADLVAEGFCGAAERCDEDTAGAECVRGQCIDGFVYDDGECVEGTPNCFAGEPGSMVESCATLARSCVVVGGFAECGECTGETTEIDGVCEGPVPCADTRCSSHQYCERTGATPFCADLPCPAGQARGTTGACSPCSFTCAGEGLSGRVFPFRTLTDACVCETLPGWYMPPGGSTDPEPCDADDDGWVRAEVTESLIEVDPTLVQNARCALIEVDGVVLRDEQGLSVEVASCEDGLFVEPEPADCAFRVPMPLVESLRNDTPGLVGGDGVGAPAAYGARRLDAREVNDLTKYCVDDASDFNDDGTDDLLEEQAPGATLGSADGRTRLRSFAHFVELHRAFAVEPAPGAAYGKLVVEERFRCDPRDFPLRYDPAIDPAEPTDGYVSGVDAVYWRSCQRGVDPSFDPTSPGGLGFDFAQWSCEGADCDTVPAGPPHRSVDLVTEPLAFGDPVPRGATLCELGSRYPADGVWRGMNHHSQFKCVQAGGSGPAAVPLAAVNGGGLVLNDCAAVRCTAGDASCAQSRPVAPGRGTHEPVLECRALGSVSLARVGFAAVEYRAHGTRFTGPAPAFEPIPYPGGCVNEDEAFASHLCPGPVFQTFSEVGAFGRNTCFVAPCPLGTADCDGNEFNGCEMEARSLTDCNGCGVPCAPPNGVGNCSTGLCRVASCDGGWGNCDLNPDTGCETLLRTNDDCAACGRVCADPGGAETSCGTGSCQVDSCPPLTDDCDGDVGTGCEGDLTDEATCGACDIVCDPPDTTSARCTDAGLCQIDSCDFGRGDCDELPGNGCEVDILTSLDHCGTCDVACALDHASAECSAGLCLVATCDEDWANCDGVASNGCETETGEDERNCGGCFSVCDIPNATEQCSAGVCELVACDDARSECDETIPGCETRHDTVAGDCGSATSIGMGSGDTKCPSGFLGICESNSVWEEITVQRGVAGQWFSVRLVEDSVCSAVIEHRIRLKVPSGANYDLHLQTECETGSTRTSSTETGDAEETIRLRRADNGAGTDDSIEYRLFIEYVSGASCEEWELVVEGHSC